ncbi:MAG TPA: N-acyl homoserine lactonase family protein [Candidatus Limnocylindria bacterium]
MARAQLSRIRPLHTGHYTMPATDTRFPNDRIIVTAFLIEHPEGLFLFDTGFSATHWQAVETFAPVDIRPIRTVLSENGIRAADVRMIANCHFHSDHSGGNFNFPGVPIFVQRAEVAHLRADPDYSHAPSVADFPGAVLEEVDGEAEPLPGIRIIPTPGHSPGHQSLAVETAEGRVILGGQAFNFTSDYARQRYSLELALRGEPHGPYPEWLARFQELDPVRIRFAHDTVTWERNAQGPIG